MSNYRLRDMISHMLTPLRGTVEAGHLVTNTRVFGDEAAVSDYGAIPAGRCMHLTGTTDPNTIPVAKLGCSGNNKIPVFIFRSSDSWSVGVAGPDSTQVTHPSWAGGEYEKVLVYVGLEGFELMTTEFDTEQDYKVGDYLCSPEATEAVSASVATDLRDAVNNYAGKLTKKTLADSDVLYGVDTIVGIVSAGVHSDMDRDNEHDVYGNKVLPFYTTYRPPLQGVPAELLE